MGYAVAYFSPLMAHRVEVASYPDNRIKIAYKCIFVISR